MKRPKIKVIMVENREVIYIVFMVSGAIILLPDNLDDWKFSN